MARVYKQVFELGNIITGKTPSTSDISLWNGNIPFITPTDIKGFDVFYQGLTERTVSSLGASKQKKTVLPPNAVCISSIATIGKMCLTSCESITNQQINSIVVNNANDYRYVLYLLRYNLPYLQLVGGGSGSGTPIISKNKFAKFRFLVEDNLPTQQKIASILSAYDRLIENNTRRIRLLEQMAENIYKEWFVRFRFPEHEKVEIVNGLPKGWERTKLIKNIKTSSGGTPSRNKGEYYKNGTIPWIKTGELQDCILINTEECITEDAVNNSSAKLFPKGTLLMAMYGVNVGKLGISEIEATCNQACCVFTPKQIDYKYYLFHYLKSIREYLLSISFGAAQQNLSQELIKSIRVLFPDEKTNISFVKEVEPLFKEISIIQQQNQLLTRQRDLLLPRLMSGKLEVKS
ncbi:MAG: restriction endonuclease subunit S [Prevotella histicola]|jgi:type I restriction-modification system specificity subunit|nr:restriction endonuclease subunit S [Prevotella histicola]